MKIWPLGDKTMKPRIRNSHTLSPLAIVGPLTSVPARFMIRILPMLSAAFCLLVAPGAFAANWYVDNAVPASGNGTHSAEIGELAGSVCPPQCYVSPIGSDTNSGSSSAPWRTINKAASVASAGTTVHVAPGVYKEKIAMSRSGTASNRIRFVSDVRWGAKIWPTQNLNSHIFRITGSYVDVEGFDMGPAGSNVIVFGVDTTGTNNKFAHNKIHDINTSGSNTGSAVGVSGTGSVIDGNLIYHVGHSQLDHGIYAYAGSSRLINNVIGNVSGYGVSLWHTPHDVLIYNNTIINTGTRGQYSSGGILVGAGEDPNSDARNCIVANNIVYGSPSFGIMEGGTTHNNLYINNLTYNNNRDWGLQNGTQLRNISADPKFVSYKAYGTGNYSLRPSSPAINRASPKYAPATDFDGNNRPVGGAPDIGAYEFRN
jgi:hypothetical protein